MLLSDKTIKEELKAGRLVVDPLFEKSIQPSSVDLHLSNNFRVFKHAEHPVIDIRKGFSEYTEPVLIKDGGQFIIHPSEFVLGATIEKVKIPGDLVGRLEGKSSLGRLGIIIHATAGFIDPGFEGIVTLEMSNVGKIPVALYPGMKIAQLSFIKMTTQAEHLYGSKEVGSKYQGQAGPTESKIFKEYT